VIEVLNLEIHVPRHHLNFGQIINSLTIPSLQQHPDSGILAF
jgi:hypothetical protein